MLTRKNAHQRSGLKIEARILLGLLTAAALLAWGLSSSAVNFKPPSANLDQIRNGSFSSPIDPPAWVNGNAGSSNAHYREGQSIAYRLRLDDLPLGTHTVEIEWDIRHSSTNAIDYITYYDRIAEAVNPLLGLTGTFASPNTFPIPTPPVSTTAGTVNGLPQPTTSFNNLPAAEKLFTIYNGTITNMVYINNADGNLGDLTAAQSSTRLSITLTNTASSVVLAWGGHIASRLDWGTGNSASGISGSPYHTRLISLDGSGGNQDRSLSAAAVLPPAPCSIDGSASVCSGSTNTYLGPTGAATYSWTISGNGIFDLGGGVTSATASTQNVTVISSGTGSYTLTLTVTQSGSSDSTCSKTVPVNGNPAVTISLSNACLTTASLTANPTGGSGSYTYLWSGPSNNGATTQSITPTVVGTYSVRVTDTNACSGSATNSLCFVLQ